MEAVVDLSWHHEQFEDYLLYGSFPYQVLSWRHSKYTAVSVFVLLRLDRITSIRAKRTLASLKASISNNVYDRIDIHVFSIILILNGYPRPQGLPVAFLGPVLPRIPNIIRYSKHCKERNYNAM